MLIKNIPLMTALSETPAGSSAVATITIEPFTGAVLQPKPPRPHSVFHYISRVYATRKPLPAIAEECAA